MTTKELWNNTELFIIDIDGTFRHGKRIADGAREFLELIRSSGKNYIFFTNNSSISPQKYICEFEEQNCYIQPQEIASTADVAAYYLKEHYPNKPVYVVGTKLFCDYLQNQGIQLSENADVVLVGFDKEFNYQKLENACRLIQNGADFLATHLDRICPMEDGFIPDCGSICASIICATEKQPIVLGKPEKATFDYVLNMAKTRAENITFIGDRISTDIAIGKNYFAQTALVLGGDAKLEDIENTQIVPDVIYSSIGDMYKQCSSVSECCE